VDGRPWSYLDVTALGRQGEGQDNPQAHPEQEVARVDEHPESQAVTMGSHPGVHPYVRYCRIAAVAFGLVAAYTLVVKVPRGGMAQDWLHTALHVVTGALALYLGLAPPRVRGAARVHRRRRGVVRRRHRVTHHLRDPTGGGRQPVHLALALAGLLFIAVAGRR
jgi:hypothetical protein